MSRAGYKPKGYRVAPLGRPAIRKDAHIVLDAVRQMMHVTTPMVPVVDVIERMDAEGFFLLDIRESHHMGSRAAELQPGCQGQPPTLCVSEKVYEEACAGDGFSRFTLAHELGHYFLHSRQRIALPRTRGELTHKPYEDSEWQANTFAGEFLVDSRQASSLCGCAEDVANTYGLSLTAAHIQWSELCKMQGKKI